jgi:hypothetical protein
VPTVSVVASMTVPRQGSLVIELAALRRGQLAQRFDGDDQSCAACPDPAEAICKLEAGGNGWRHARLEDRGHARWQERQQEARARACRVRFAFPGTPCGATAGEGSGAAG